MSVESACINMVTFIATGSALMRFAISECEAVRRAWRKFATPNRGGRNRQNRLAVPDTLDR